MKKSYIGLYLVVITIIFSFTYLQNAHNKNEEQIVTVFEDTDFNVIQSNIHSWGIIETTFLSYVQMEEKAKEIAQELGIQDNWTIEKKESEKVRELSLIKPSKNAKTVIKMESMRYEEDQVVTYAIIDILLYNQFNSTIHLKEEMNHIFEEREIMPNTNITMTGIYNGKMTKDEKKEISKNIMKNIDAKIQESFETEEIYSVYGYTRIIDDYIMSNNKKVNVNLALRYNEYEGKTYLYLATPVITVEY